MDASAEPTYALRAGRRALEEFADEVKNVGHWEVVPGSTAHWMLSVELIPHQVGESVFVPTTTRWILVASTAYPLGELSLWPAADGIEATFPHQLPNRPPEDPLPWRTGRICTSESVSGHPLAIAMVEPRSAEERLAWHVRRALDWLRDASADRLLKAGDPFELPVYGPARAQGQVVAFKEGVETFATWASRRERSGIVLLRRIDARGRSFAVTSFRRGSVLDIVEPAWGRFLELAEAVEYGIWLRFDDLVVMPPYRAPWTWGEIREFARSRDRNLDEELEPLAEHVRDGRQHFVLIGFPIPERVGGSPSIFHWTAVQLEPLNNARRNTPRAGFRTQTARWRADRSDGPLSDKAALSWVTTQNWDQRQLSSRGFYEGAFRGRSVALIGAGALGSVFAEQLVRGGVSNLLILDGDVLSGGNLVRHSLTVRDVGESKATALAKRLNAAAPNAEVVGIAASFPEVDADEMAAFKQMDIIVDSTGEDEVIHAMSDESWPEPKLFASISMSYGARRLYVFTASGVSFPASHFLRLFGPWRESDPISPDEMRWEGAGCWGSVFPARHDDVTALAALSSRTLDSILDAAPPMGELRVFVRTDDGAIERLAQPRSED